MSAITIAITTNVSKSIQYFTVAFTGTATSATATLSAVVVAKTFLVHLQQEGNVAIIGAIGRMTLTNTTTVTVTRQADTITGTLTFSGCAIEFF